MLPVLVEARLLTYFCFIVILVIACSLLCVSILPVQWLSFDYILLITVQSLVQLISLPSKMGCYKSDKRQIFLSGIQGYQVIKTLTLTDLCTVKSNHTIPALQQNYQGLNMSLTYVRLFNKKITYITMQPMSNLFFKILQNALISQSHVVL